MFRGKGFIISGITLDPKEHFGFTLGITLDLRLETLGNVIWNSAERRGVG